MGSISLGYITLAQLPTLFRTLISPTLKRFTEISRGRPEFPDSNVMKSICRCLGKIHEGFVWEALANAS